MAPAALVKFSVVEVAAFVINAVRADKAIRSAQFGQCFGVFFFVAVVFQKIIEAKTFLGPDRNSFHSEYSLYISIVYMDNILPKSTLLMNGN